MTKKEFKQKLNKSIVYNERLGYMGDHPERAEEEFFLYNTSRTSGDFTITGPFTELKTYRVGDVAYDLNRKELDPNFYRPVFIHYSEYAALDKILMNRKNEKTKS